MPDVLAVYDAPNDVAEVVRRLRGFFDGRPGGDYLVFSAWPTPDLGTSDFGRVGHPPLMVRPVGPLDERPVDGLEVRPVTDEATALDWERTFVDGYPEPALQPHRPGCLLPAEALAAPRWRHWVGYLDGAPVATSSAFVGDHHVDVEFVSTLPSARGRGIGRVLTATASLAPDLLCLTFNGLSKAYRVAGFRTGWMVVSGPKKHATSYIEGLEMLANMRLCLNVPTQYAVQTALGGYQSINDLVLPGGRLADQRDTAWRMLNAIPGVSCVKPKGALYAFPRLDPDVYEIHDDEKLVQDLLLQEKILMVQGTGFNWPNHDHLRIVTLPWARDLAVAIERFGNFLSSYKQ